MSRLVVFVLAFAVVLAFAPAVAQAIPRGEDGEKTQAASLAVGELRVERAAELIDDVARRHERDPDVRAVRAMVHFHRGNYTAAAHDMEAAVQDRSSPAYGERRALLELIRATDQATRNYATETSTDGRYIIRYSPGRDEALLPYAFEALRRADEALARDIGLRVPGPIRLEIYPSARGLAQVSSLSVEEIERTGTIALCKWDRLMVTSPRALLRGYPWVDTIGHEFVHLVLARASHDHAPVWFQEGVAKYLERRWRGEAASAHLEPTAQALLHRAVRDGELLSFDDLHPSIARLPSQEHAALAFAQVATFIETFVDQHGIGVLRDAISQMATGVDARDALAAASGQAFGRLEQGWRNGLRSLSAPADPPRQTVLRFAHAGAEADEAEEVSADARRFFRLGNMLYDRSRPRAAAVEYQRALALAPDEPLIASRLGRAALEGGDPRRATDALRGLADRYPTHAPTQAVFGSALVAQGEASAGRRVLREAIWLNPFDPQPHCYLVLAAENESEERRERRLCTFLGGAVP
ncbi:MAG: tetratricopeptide repeat protein [Myxococcota bacterium]